MQRKKRLSDEFIGKLAQLTAGALPSEQFDLLISLFEHEVTLHYFTNSSESNLIRIIENQYDKIFFLKECIRYPHKVEVLVTLASNSNYLSDILVRNPEYFFVITNPERLKTQLSEYDYTKLVNDTVERFKTFESKVNALRNLKRRELLRIGLTDIYLKAPLQRITTELSLLANNISAVLFDLCYKEILSKYKIEKLSNKYCLVALGKLGGGELNYSSDIDLIAFSDKNTFINKKIYYNQILSETIKLFIEQASSITSKGFLYRVDFRLRPDGRNAPLCSTISQYLHYYEMRGEDWERQMLIKAGYVCGNNSLYDKFISFIQKFIYPAIFKTSPIQQIKKLKKNIEKSFSNETNIKLLPGGIRDIEFSIQALQLLNGGRIKDLRTGNSIGAIVQLAKNNLLSEDESKIFSEAYTFYRRIEHYLQLMNNAQTHTIPDSGELPEKIANYLGFKTSNDFRKKLNSYREKVSEIYKSITGEVEVDSGNLFSDIIFTDPKRAMNNIEFLNYGKGILSSKKFDTATIQAFDNVKQNFLSHLKTSLNPDLILENFTRIIKSAQFPGIWYKEFYDSNFFSAFLRICEFSQFTINLFAEDKFLRDLFLSRKCFEKVNSLAIEELSTRQLLFVLSVQFTSGIINHREVSFILSEFIRDKIKTITEQLFIGKGWQKDYIIIGMGSFGIKEITFASDIDLIFIINKIEKFPTIQTDFQNFLLLLKKELSPFDVDCRLRPEGKGSYLVWDLKTYCDYLKSRARTWELQATLKASLVAGNDNLFSQLLLTFDERLRATDHLIIKKEINEMRKKMLSGPGISDSTNLKKSAGGLIDLDFIIAYYLLTNSNMANKLTGSGTEKVVNALSLEKRIDLDFNLLLNNYIFLKKTELSVQNIFNTRTSQLPADHQKLKMLSGFLGYENIGLFQKEFNTVVQNNMKLFKQVFN